MITRSAGQAADFQKRLESQGARVVAFPTIAIHPPDSWEPMDQAIQNISSYQLLIFTSANGAESFFGRMKALGKDARLLKQLSISAIGPATARIIEKQGLAVETLPEEYRAEGLVLALHEKIRPGVRVLIPRAKVARELLPQEIRKLGGGVEIVPAYQTLVPPHARDRFFELMREGALDMIVFSSSSTVNNLAQIVAPLSLPQALAGTSVACIGPITAETCHQLGLKVSVQPASYDIPSLVEAIRIFYS